MFLSKACAHVPDFLALPFSFKNPLEPDVREILTTVVLGHALLTVASAVTAIFDVASPPELFSSLLRLSASDAEV